MDPLASAKSFATLHHVIKNGQMYGNIPYTHHLETVEKILREYGVNEPELLTAAWLHDIVEDTDVKVRDVVENFGDEVGRLVFAVTTEKGESRKVKNAITYPKIRDAGYKAVRLKLADRLANTRNNGGSLDMYIKEYPGFRHALWSPMGDDEDETNQLMWAELDKIMGFKPAVPLRKVEYGEEKD